MHVNAIKSCYIGPEISPEQFIAEHFFLYLGKGKIEGYDGHRKYILEEGQYCIVRKNHLARYNKQKNNGEFEKVVIILDEAFLKKYQQQHTVVHTKPLHKGAFILPGENKLIRPFIQSLMPYYEGGQQLNSTFADIKREELLMILLQHQPQIADVLFDFRLPDKLDLEAYMNRNYKFNVGVERFAYLTGRSLSAFKRDFAAIFGTTPHRWLQQKRLQEAYFLIEKKRCKPSDIYLELGFEDLSHFSYAFKKHFGETPSGLLTR
ncbi:helix-turn-helix domain-containing protein [Chitinophaga arvensicola]|uniref:AraC-type DNA-binding protein n=1 Tax=Chitinophaga arvensicola TaxID=29529 RepID=A0A1I0SC26_9BACT|nr:AraC family transcriptional regulator [Chitinophaga arvensicola]SEW53095.1 AraC-type DNA-binding protein [Chitinophaga arvensicola]